MIQKEFYLSSHDLGDPRPRRCEVVNKAKGLLRSNSCYILVKIDPPLTTQFWDSPSKEFDQIILAIVENYKERDIGKKPVIADIVICPSYSGGSLDERKCSRVGMGSIHATYAEALENSPVENE